MRKLLKSTAFTVLTITTLVGCSQNNKLVTSIDIVKDIVSLIVGEEEILLTNISPEDATNKELTWASENESIATVDSIGKVKAVSEGTTIITATAKDGSGKSDSCSIKVSKATKKVTSISFNTESISLQEGMNETIQATVLPEDATNKELTWSSTSEDVATVDQTGKVTGVGIGSSFVTATAKDGSGVSKSIPVVVEKKVPVESVTLDKKSVDFIGGESTTLTATVLPETAGIKDLDWSVDNPDIASYKDGIVTGMKSGSAVVTATAKDGSGKSDSCSVNVNKYRTVSGEFTESGDKIISSKENSSALFFKNIYENGYSISANMQANTDNKSGIIFNAKNDLSKYYLLSICYDNGYQLKLMEYNDTGYSLLKGCYVTAGYSKTAAVNLKVVVNSSEIRCLFNGKELLFVKNNNGLENPYVGVLTESPSSQFYNVIIDSTCVGETFDTLIAGHSYAELWSNYKEDLSELSNDIGNIGIGGTASTDWINHVDEIVDHQPNKIIFMMGINDIPRSTTVADIASNISNTLNQIVEKLPNIKICLLSTNRCPNLDSAENIAKIRNLNVEMKKYVSKHLDNVVYGNLDNAFVDTNAEVMTDSFIDGLHPTADSYKYIAKVVKDAFTHFERREADTKKTVIIGHSYMDNWKETCKADLDLYKDVTNIGLGGSTSEYWRAKVDEIVDLKPERLIYMIGINDIHHKINNGSLYENIKKLLTTIKSSCADVEVTILSVNQVPLDYSKFNLEIADANTFLKRLCVEYDWIHYGNLDNAFMNASLQPNKDLFMEGDFGLHPNMDQYDIVAKAIYNAFDGKEQPETYSTSGLVLAENIVSSEMPESWSKQNDTIVSNSNGFALSKNKYSDFMTTIVLDGVYEGPDGDDEKHNPWFSHILTKGIVIGGSVTEAGTLKGYVISLTKNWIQLGYLDGVGIGGNPYKCSGIVATCQLDPDNIAITIRVSCGSITIYKPNGQVGFSYSMPNYEKGSIGIFGNDDLNFKTTLLEFNDFSSYEGSIANSIKDSETLPSDWSVADNTISSKSNGFALSSKTYTDVTFMINMNGVYEGPDGDDENHNPFFSHEVTKGIIIGGSVTEAGTLKGYVISLTKNWVHICYLDGVGEGENPYKITGTLFSYNFDPNKVSFIVKISGNVIQLYHSDGETLYKDAFGGKTSYKIDKYNGGFIGTFATDGYEFSTSFLNLNKWPYASKEVYK